MKKLFGFFLILIGIITMLRYPNLGRDMAETAGAMTVVLLLVFFGYRLVKAKPN
jgi:multisubunit Na+/H+ antiporter MnhG subunit